MLHRLLNSPSCTMKSIIQYSSDPFLPQLILSGNAPGDESGELESKLLGPNEVQEIARLEPHILEVFSSNRSVHFNNTSRHGRNNRTRGLQQLVGASEIRNGEPRAGTNLNGTTEEKGRTRRRRRTRWWKRRAASAA